MARSTKPPRRLPKSLRKGPLPYLASDVWLAGVGALAHSLDTGRGRFDTLLARGRHAQAEGSKAVQATIQQAVDAEAHATSGALAAAEALAMAAEQIVTEHVPEPSAVTVLREKVDALSARVAAMGGGPTDVTVAATPEGWTVSLGAHVACVCKTRREAVAAGRREARVAAPSRLVVKRTDGTDAETATYGA